MSGKFLASKRARISAVSSALTRATRTTHHCGPNLARVSRLSSSVHEAYLFLGFLISLSSTCSLQLVALLSLLSFLSRLLSLAVSCSVLAEIDIRGRLVVVCGNGREGKERECWQGLLHRRSPCFIIFFFNYFEQSWIFGIFILVWSSR